MKSILTYLNAVEFSYFRNKENFYSKDCLSQEINKKTKIFINSKNAKDCNNCGDLKCVVLSGPMAVIPRGLAHFGLSLVGTLNTKCGTISVYQ